VTSSGTGSAAAAPSSRRRFASASSRSARRPAIATAYLEAFGHVVLAWIWLEQARAAHGKAGDFYDGKRQACRYFFRWELPRTGPQFALLDSIDDTTLAMRDAWF
jgi:butyryl-CoA dehydrogenase